MVVYFWAPTFTAVLASRLLKVILSDIFEMVQYSDTISLSYMIHVAYSNISQSTNFCYDMLINK